MAWASKGTLGTVASSASSTSSLALTTVTTAVAVGNVVIVAVSKDNVTTTSGVNSNEVTSVTDSAGNTYTKIYEWANGRTAANGGVVAAAYYSKATVALSVGGTITANFSSSITAKAITARVFTASGNVLVQTTGRQTSQVTAGALGALTVSGLASAEYLFLHVFGVESNAAVAAGADTFTDFTSIASTGGAAATNVGVGARWKIATGTTSGSSTPGTVSVDNTAFAVALTEMPVPAPASGTLTLTGVAPSLALAIGIAAGSLSFTGQAPTVLRSATVGTATRYEVGTYTANGTISTVAGVIPAVTLQTGDSLVVVTGMHIGSVDNVKWNGISLSGDRQAGPTDDKCIVWSMHGVTGATGDIDIECSGSSGSTSVALTATRWVGIGPRHQSGVATSTSTTPSATTDLPTTVPKLVIVGGLYTNGPPADSAGTWTNDTTAAGQRAGATNATVADGYGLASATGSKTASKTGITSRLWGAIVVAYELKSNPIPQPGATSLTLTGVAPTVSVIDTSATPTITLVRLARPAKGRRPSGPIVLNPDSPQAQGLSFWAVPTLGIPGMFNPLTGVYGVRHIGDLAIGPNYGRASSSDQTIELLTGQGNDEEYLQIPYTSPNTNVVTFTSWLYCTSHFLLGVPMLSQNPRGQGLSTNRGAPITNDSLVGFWDITSDEFDAATGLVMPLNEWFLGAFVVTPTRGTTYIISSAGLSSYANVKTHSAKVIDLIAFGADAAVPVRRWIGSIGDSRIYLKALSVPELLALYSPQTRWDLYNIPGTGRRFDIASAVPAGGSATITVPVGTLTLTGVAPTVPLAINRAVPSGSLTFTGQAPFVATNNAEFPGSGSLTFTGQTPSVATNIARAPGSGTLTLTGQTPSLVTLINLAVPSGTLTFTGVAPSVLSAGNYIPSPANLTLTGQAPTLVFQTSYTVPSGTLTLTGVAPAVQTGITVPVGNLSLTGVAPSVATNFGTQPGSGTLTLTGQVPNVGRGVSLLPGVGTLTFTGVAPSLNRGSNPPAGTLTFTGVAPNVGLGTGYAVPAGSLTFSGVAPSLNIGRGVPVGTLTLTGQAPTVITQFVIGVPSGTLTLTGQLPSLVALGTVAPSTGTLTFTGQAPTLVYRISYGVPVGSLTFSGVAPTVVTLVNRAVPVGTLTLSGVAPTVATNFVRSPGSGTLTFTGQAPAITSLGVRNPGTGTLTFTGVAPTVVILVGNRTPGTGTLTFTGQAPTVAIGTNTIIQVPTKTLRLDGLTPYASFTVGPPNPPPNTTPETALWINPTPYASGDIDPTDAPASTYPPVENQGLHDYNWQALWWKYIPPPGVTALALTYGAPVALNYYPMLSMWIGTPPALVEPNDRGVFSSNIGYITMNVTPGVLHYFQMSNTSNVPSTGQVVFLNAIVPPDLDVPVGSLIVSSDVNGYPLVAVGRGAPVGPILKVVGQPSYEMAEWLDNGLLAVIAETDDENTADTLKFYNYDLTFRQDVPGVFTSGVSSSVSTITSNRLDTFWVTDDTFIGGVSSTILRKVSSLGVVTTLLDIAPLIGQPNAIGVNADETILYLARSAQNYGATFFPDAIARWDLVNNVPMADLVDLSVMQIRMFRDVLVMDDESILIATRPQSSSIATAQHTYRWSSTGVLLNDYAYTSTNFPRLRRDPQDPTVFWLMSWPNGTNRGESVYFKKIRLSDGVVLETVSTPLKYPQDGSLPLYGPAQSCPLLLNPLAIVAGVLRLTQLPVVAAYDYSVLQTYLTALGLRWATPPRKC